ncbi:hypothetical protein T459_23379 [Capsicum annuum]|uniref:Peptidase M3A/M3B catalytic domain-containing protein n=1 Tax=Capsicum annuum TaxID=4072 RepID=A0A2G2YSD6_CAPAN|nr:hypothetical protein T459_23379 [Capsicum annuum]
MTYKIGVFTYTNNDVDWAGSPSDRRSISGYCVLVGGYLVSWKSIEQSVVARSSVEAEYRAMAAATCELVWIKQLLRELKFGETEIDCYFVRKKILSGDIVTKFVKSSDQLANIFTKSLTSPRINYICDNLGTYDLKREDVYRVVKALTVTGDGLSADAKSFTRFLVREFERNGVNLTLSKKEELQRLTTNIDELSMQYIRNLDDDCSFLLFTDVELDGLPPEFLKSLERYGDGNRKIILRSHQVSPVLELCKVGSTRRAVAISYGRRCEANVTILEQLIQLRHKLARLLGFANYADYATDDRMAKSSSKVGASLIDD